VGVIDTLLQFLEGLSHDPVAYSIVFFLYAVAATVFLPIPVELGLFLSTNVPIFVNALVLGAGKAVGSMLVFYLGDRVGGSIFNVFSKTRVLRAFVRGMRWFVDKTRYLGLYFILSTPLMVDTIPVYIFSLFNQKGLMRIEYFALTNFFAGITRAIIVYLIFYLLGIKLT
jgi:membrane protein DedA with SNARE-associated domain